MDHLEIENRMRAKLESVSHTSYQLEYIVNEIVKAVVKL